METTIAKRKSGRNRPVKKSINQFVNEDIERILVPTVNHELMIKWILYARQKRKLVMIIAQNGYGKTSTLQKLEREIPSAKYFKVGKGEPAKRFYARFLSELDPSEEQDIQKLMKKSYIFYLMDSASYIINERNDIDLIMIDEFGNFTKQYITHIRQIWDDIKHRAGMVLAGPPSVFKDLIKWQKEGSQGVNELLSRVGPNKIVVKRPKLVDIKMVCKSRGIMEMNVINFLYKSSQDLRILHELIDQYKNGKIEID